MKFFATAPSGLSELLREELMALGAQNVKAQPRGVAFEGGLVDGYRACLWSRLANRIYLVLVEAELPNQEALYDTVRAIDWSRHMSEDHSFAISFTGKGMGIEHTHFGALKIKDAVVDYFRDNRGVRPSVDVDYADIRLHGHLNRNQFTLSLDLSGHSLHQRGYREGQQVKAPLKENIAAAILIRSGWLDMAKQGGVLYDPMCGSGTFLIEAAMIAADSAPGLAKAQDMGFLSWLGHQREIWSDLVVDAEKRESEGLKNLPAIYGSDSHPGAIKIARQAIQQAGLDGVIEVQLLNINEAKPWGEWTPGLVVANPPYGERLGEEDEVKALYVQIGECLKTHFVGWQAAVLTCNKELGLYLGIKAKRDHSFFNGALECKLFRFDIQEEFFRQPALKAGVDLAAEVEVSMADLAQTEGAQMFANRLRKNLKILRKWADRNKVMAFRVYDADMPEYALAIDYYHTLEAGEWLVVNEYAAPKTVNAAKAKRRLYEAMSVLPDVMDIPSERILFKIRQRQRGGSQYEKLEERKDYFTIIENGAKLRVNFADYLDTGVFLDHRDVRAMVGELSKGKRLLNLFCYTATATVQAAVKGANSSLSVDMSKTYLYWAKHNFMTNDMDLKRHELLQEDVVAWLQNPPELTPFDVIFLDPPSFSSSKRMEGVLDVQRDYVDLIEQAGHLLTQNGVLVFSNNRQKFKLDPEALSAWAIEDITRKTLPEDFKRSPKIHQAWLLRKK
ncbi:MAG: bifunctional 23S rRNA (guanine(2069)-N(7))-methyltransferase RlmK/23S rRNA (guanine(2445)-N(2))-methyltransferase RlmL [Thiomicrospira sp.]|uniref:bifunctional 23S rRNA (guanine(2069)-N(7))-methyltransferase RlmK/23S rRNA (guanine(2445)-N(2))-methyltransferase RlmL n=1 Tax=Thiomicrospira sp. TaxID=935 RepID=UPI0019D8550A|nr:bifunctional 23S rRNA (guanine(2069)-N(7))-methyltransferase RlmK/23S rRNA (guanine(2445)-N(2))-methyltransferase RlmL [Thiomicrospira sp.]MBE0493979.1 bifunctional 23S rRNA (guanine(2069)-N(7))-methyltransferase RlmK/23S rRNA (guanine(2445)-N(2))-methyltransferase RlmL [Thiomicrospira sp.]